jgi:hypothetical protein
MDRAEASNYIDKLHRYTQHIASIPGNYIAQNEFLRSTEKLSGHSFESDFHSSAEVMDLWKPHCCGITYPVARLAALALDLKDAAEAVHLAHDNDYTNDDLKAFVNMVLNSEGKVRAHPATQPPARLFLLCSYMRRCCSPL